MKSSMIIRSAVACLVSGTVLLGGTSTAAALPSWVPVIELPYPGPVLGGERDIPDRALSQTTANGWVLHVEKTQEKLNFAPPLTGDFTTGETFGSLAARAWVDGQSAEPLRSGVFEAGYQISCNVSVADGADVKVSTVTSISPSVGITPTLEGILKLFRFDFTPTVDLKLKPGKITNVKLAGYDMNLDKKQAAASVTGAHIHVAGCAGPVSVRSYVSLATTTDTSRDTAVVYGDSRRIR